MKKLKFACVISVVALISLPACKTEPQMTNRPDFLTTYDHLQKVETGVWRYVSPPLLANCTKFTIDPVQIMFSEYDGKPITPEQKQRSADFVRDAMIKAVGQWYPIVSQRGPDVGEIRIALTEGYKTAGKLGICLQGEILDNSNTQVAAVVRTEISQYYSPSWEDKDTAKAMVQAWADRLLKALDESRRK